MKGKKQGVRQQSKWSIFSILGWMYRHEEVEEKEGRTGDRKWPAVVEGWK